MATFTLTTGTDTFAGGASFVRDLFQGTTSDWQQSDTLDGGNGNDILQITVLSAAAASVGDTMFQHITNMEDLALIGKYAETVQLSAKSEAAGIVELDGSGLTGNLTVDASTRFTGVTIDSAKGVNNLTGTVSNDTFKFTSAGLTSLDKVDGGGVGDKDAIQITDKAALTDAAFTKVTNVEILEFGVLPTVNYAGQHVTLGAHSVAAGIMEVDVLNEQGATINAAARSVGITVEGDQGDDVLVGGIGTDILDGGLGNDTLMSKEAQFNGSDHFNGGGGRDTVRIIDSGKAIVDFDFQYLHSVETLAFSAAGKQTVTLDSKAAAAGLDTVDASKVSGGLNLTLGAGMTTDMTVDLGTGVDHIALGSGGVDTVVMRSTSLTKADTIVGDGNDFLAFGDAVKLTDQAFASNFNGLSGITYLELNSGAKGQLFVAGANFSKLVASEHIAEVIANGAAPTTSVTFDFSKFTGSNTFAVNGSGGGDVFIAGSKDVTFFGTATDSDQGIADTFVYHSADFSAADTIFGGKSTGDTLLILDNASTIADSAFQNTFNVEILKLGAVKTGSYGFLLGANAEAAGIDTVDASKAGVDVLIAAGAQTVDMTFIGGTKNNHFIGGSGDDTFVFDAKTFNSGDIINGATSTNGDTLKFSTAGAVTSAAFTNVSNVEFVQLSDKGNAIALSDAMVTTGETINTTAYDNYSLSEKVFVLTGHGKDTVDLSQLTTGQGAGHVAVIGSAGGDKYIGSNGNDTFVFEKPADLAVGTVIDGNKGSDQLVLGAGTYTAAQLKGISDVLDFRLEDANPAASYSLTLTNPMFSGHYTHSITIAPDDAMTGDLTVDASAVTDPLATLFYNASTGNNFVKGTAGDDLFSFGIDQFGHSELDQNDVLAGGAGNDEVVLSFGGVYNGTLTLSDSDISHVSGIEFFNFLGSVGSHWDLTLDSKFQAEGVAAVNFLQAADTNHLDATQYTTDLLVIASAADSTYLTGSGNDVFKFNNNGLVDAQLSANDVINGGTGNNSLLFYGSATVADSAFTHVSNVQEVDAQSSQFILTLGTHSDAAGIKTVDATQAGTAVSIDGSAAHNQLSLYGSDFADTLKGGIGFNALVGGGGNDQLYGGSGPNEYVYQSAADSHLGSGGSLANVDTINNFHSGDIINIDDLVGGSPAVLNKGTVVNIPTSDIQNFFNNGVGNVQVAVEYDNSDTWVFVDANHDHNFNAGQDLVVKVVGNHVTDLADPMSYNQ